MVTLDDDVLRTDQSISTVFSLGTVIYLYFHGNLFWRSFLLISDTFDRNQMHREH